MVRKTVETLVAQAKELERAIAALNLRGIAFQGSDSLDSPGSVGDAE